MAIAYAYDFNGVTGNGAEMTYGISTNEWSINLSGTRMSAPCFQITAPEYVDISVCKVVLVSFLKYTTMA